MTFRRALRREVYVAIHGQSARFRVAKYILFAALGVGLQAWGGWPLVGTVFAALLALALAVHLLFRWKTKAWTESWGPYRKIDLPE